MKLLSEDFEDEARDTQSKNPVATTWSILLKRIKSHGPKASDLLLLMSMLDSQAFPECVLPVGTDPIMFEKALG